MNEEVNRYEKRAVERACLAFSSYFLGAAQCGFFFLFYCFYLFLFSLFVCLRAVSFEVDEKDCLVF